MLAGTAHRQEVIEDRTGRGRFAPGRSYEIEAHYESQDESQAKPPSTFALKRSPCSRQRLPLFGLDLAVMVRAPRRLIWHEEWMLSWFTKGLRLRAALVLAVAYALCVMAPPVALAFTDGSAAAHCLFEDSSSVPHVHAQWASSQAAPHVHTTSASHSHPDVSGPIKSGDDTQAAVVGCCGLFSAPAISSKQNVLFAGQHLKSPAFPARDDVLNGRGPDRLHRPPIAL